MVQVRMYLEAARAEGVGFDDAWAAIFRRMTTKTGPVVFSHKTSDRYDQAAALEATREEWAAAYERRPTRLSLALEEVWAAGTEDATSAARRSGEERVTLAIVPLPTPGDSRVSGRRAMAAA